MIQSTVTHTVAWLKHLLSAPRRSALRNLTIYRVSHLSGVKEERLASASLNPNSKGFHPLRAMIALGNRYRATARWRHERLLSQSVNIFALLLLLFLLIIFSMDSAAAQAELTNEPTPAVASELERNLERMAPSRAPRYLLQE